MRLKIILPYLNQAQKALKEYGIKLLSLFAFTAREEDKETSDVDILVTFNWSLGLFAFMELKDHLEGMLGAHVDLVTSSASTN